MSGATEYERLLAALQPRLAHVRLADLTEKDAEFLGGETGTDTELVGFAVLGARLAREIGLPNQIFYALVREGLPTDLSALAVQPAGALRSALERAVSGEVVPSGLGDQLEVVLDRFRELLADVTMPQGSQGRLLVDRLLERALPGADVREAFLGLLKEYGRPDAGFWRALRTEGVLSAAELDRVHEAMQLAMLAGNHVPLLERLADGPEISSPADAAKLELSDWIRLIGGEGDESGVGVPQEVRGDTEEQRVRTYAEAITRSVERAFPTAVVAARITKSDIPGKEDLAGFLEKNPSFQLASMDVEAYIQRRGEVACEDVQEPEELIGRVRSIQRVFTLTPSWHEAEALVHDGLDSALEVVSLGEDDFADRYGSRLGGAERARRIHRRAKRIVRSCSGASS